MLKNALKMLYLIVHFQNISPWETPRCREVWEGNQFEKWGTGEGNQVSGNFIHPCTYSNINLGQFSFYIKLRMFSLFVLGLDWRLGAEWFESYLLDHDVCSNYGTKFSVS